jgi:hypothetical protein
MIDRIRWAQSGAGEAPSPFAKGERERPIRITFHDSTLVQLPAEEEPLEALHQLSVLPEVQAVETGRGSHPRLTIGAFDSDSEDVPLSIECDGGCTIGATLPGLPQWRRFAAMLVSQNDPQHPDVKAMLEDVVTARAHVELNRDILVTLSPRLLAHRAKPLVGEANPRTPTEAARLVGLFLRSRDNYTYAVQGKAEIRLDRGLFYWILVRHRLPNMWRYFDACVHAGKIRGDDTLYLGQSVLIRCVRALQARDAIGAQFYVPQGNNSRDAMMYHFDYLTLMLAGAFDAQARVAHRAYGITKRGERWASFRKAEFRKKLKEPGNGALHKLAVGQHFQDVTTLLYEPRNTIHGASLPTLAYHSGAEPEASFVHVPQEYSQPLWDAAGRIGTPDKWGLRRDTLVLLEPYTYSMALVDESFKLIDEIAGATDISGLFPAGHTIPALSVGPANHHLFREQIRKRLDVLG